MSVSPGHRLFSESCGQGLTLLHPRCKMWFVRGRGPRQRKDSDMSEQCERCEHPEVVEESVTEWPHLALCPKCWADDMANYE